MSKLEHNEFVSRLACIFDDLGYDNYTSSWSVEKDPDNENALIILHNVRERFDYDVVNNESFKNTKYLEMWLKEAITQCHQIESDIVLSHNSMKTYADKDDEYPVWTIDSKLQNLFDNVNKPKTFAEMGKIVEYLFKWEENLESERGYAISDKDKLMELMPKHNYFGIKGVIDGDDIKVCEVWGNSNENICDNNIKTFPLQEDAQQFKPC